MHLKFMNISGGSQSTPSTVPIYFHIFCPGILVNIGVFKDWWCPCFRNPTYPPLNTTEQENDNVAELN